MTDLGEGGRAMISEATGRYHAAMGELRDVPWRVGRSNPRNLYADTGGDWKGHPPIGAMDSPELAREAAEAHNAALGLRWLLGAGHDVQLGNCDDGSYARLLGAGPAFLAELTAPTLGEALAKAVEWSEREGITP